MGGDTVAAVRHGLTEAGSRVRRAWLRIAESLAATSAAWLVAVHVLRHHQPFFAAAAALIVLGVTRGQRLRRAVEVVIGVAGGVLVADIIARAIGFGTVWSVAAVTLLTLVVAVAVDGGPILTVQSAVSGIYVAVVTAPGGGLVPTRFADALVGGGMALLVNQLPLHRDPMAVLRQQTAPLFDALAAALDAVAAALEAGDTASARAALEQARSIDPQVAALYEAVNTGLDVVRWDPLRSRRLGPLHTYSEAARQLDYAVRNVRVLARAAVGMARGGTPAPARLPAAVCCLGRAVRRLSAEPGAVAGAGLLVTRPGDLRTAPGVESVRGAALAAVRLAGQELTPGAPLWVVMIVGQIRSTAVDLLRGTGADLTEVLAAVDGALGVDRDPGA